MQNNMEISERPTLRNGEDVSTCLPEDSRANLSAWPESGREPMTTAISGRRCCEQFGKFVPAGSWARMFSESLIGRTDWSSNRCALIWKLRGTKFNRMYFQLAVSMRRTKDTVHGLSPMLLKTPTVIDAYADRLNQKEQRFGNSGSLAQEAVSGFIYRRGLLPTVQTQGLKQCRARRSVPMPLSLLPTPTTMDSLPPKSDKAWEREMTVTRPGRSKPCNLRDIPIRMPSLLRKGLLPTPTVNDAINSSIPPSQIDRDNLAGAYLRGMLPTPKANDFRSGMPNRHGTEHTLQLNDTMAYQAGMVSRLNPLFVEEMMGFPTGWILTSFLRDCPISSVAAEAAPCVGEPSPSNATVMPSSHKSPTESC